MRSRQSYCDMLFGYLDPLRHRYSDDGSRLYLGDTSAQYEDEVVPIEAWSRVLWGLAPFWAGGGRDRYFEDVYLRGLIAGTDKASPAYWGVCRDHDQRFIEMEAIVYALHLAPHVLWEPLSSLQRDSVIAWLDQVNGCTTPDSNWRFMRVLVNLIKRSLGYETDIELIVDDLGRLMSFYAGDGWYSDGPRNAGTLDYYNSFSTHFDSLLCVSLGAGDIAHPACREFAERTRERAVLFASQCARLFSDDGQGVPYGRSLTYRFAQSAFFALAAAQHLDLGPEISHEAQKGIVARNIRWFGDRAACDASGAQSIGYAYPNLHMAEGYNAPGSPYWSLKSFAFLALPENDPFWELDEGRQRPDCVGGSGGGCGAEVEPIASGDMLVQHAGGEVLLYPCGRIPEHPLAQAPAKYGKFVYSTRFGFSVARSQRSLEESAPDSVLAFVIGRDERHAGVVLVRDGVTSYGLSPDGKSMMSSWSPWPGVEVQTEVTPCAGGGHVRTHKICSSIACEAFDCGFAVPSDYHELVLADVERTCRVRAVGPHPGEPILIKPEANTNIICGKTLIPAVHYQIPAGRVELITSVEAF